MLHEAAETLGLSHTSKGDQDLRRLTLAKRTEGVSEVAGHAAQALPWLNLVFLQSNLAQHA